MDENENNALRYMVVAGQSRFSVQAFAEGMFSAFGHDPVIAIRDFTGEARCASPSLEAASLRVTVRAGSLAVADAKSDKDRREIERAMHEDVLESAVYPDIVFESTDVAASRLARGRYRVRIVGDLTLRGVTRNNLWVYAKVIMLEDGLRAEGEFTLRQTDYGIKPFSAAGGTMKVKNELKFSFDIAAQQMADSGLPNAD